MDQRTGHTIHGGVSEIAVVSLVAQKRRGGRGSIKRKEKKRKERRIEARITGQTGPFGATQEGRKRAQEATIASTSGRLNHRARQSVQALKRSRSSCLFHSLTRRAALHEQQLLFHGTVCEGGLGG